MPPIQLTFEALKAIESIANANAHSDCGIDPAELRTELLEASLKERMPQLAYSTVQQYVHEWRTHFVTAETCTALTHSMLTLAPAEQFDPADPRALFDFMKRWFNGLVPVDQKGAN